MIVCKPVAAAQAVRRIIIARPRVAAVSAAAGVARHARRAAVVCKAVGPLVLPAALVATSPALPAADTESGGQAGTPGQDGAFAGSGTPREAPGFATFGPGGAPGKPASLSDPFRSLPGTGPLVGNGGPPASPDRHQPLVPYAPPNDRAPATAVPEPSAVAVLCLALLALALLRLRRAERVGAA